MYELQFRWQAHATGIRILQAYGDLTCLPVPSKIHGRPVTEIGPYCFSESEPRSNADSQSSETSFVSSFRLDGSSDSLGNLLEETSSASSFRLDGSSEGPSTLLKENSLTEPTLPPLKGRRLEEILLPASVQLLHNAAFYNCRGLKTLGIGHELTAIGSDVFTNCTALSHLLYQAGGEDAFALSLILGRLEMDLQVSLLNGSEITGALFFPEYYEWLDEVTPAHLFSRSIHGEGFRMRKCFQDRQLSYVKYDACFDNAIKTETGHTLCRIALLRLLWPRSLSPQAESLYKDTLNNHFETALNIIIASRKDTGFLNSIHETGEPDRKDTRLYNSVSGTGETDLIDSALVSDPALAKLRLLLDIAGTLEASQAALAACIDADWSEGAAFIMENRQRRSFAQKKYDFDDFDDF